MTKSRSHSSANYTYSDQLEIFSGFHELYDEPQDNLGEQLLRSEYKIYLDAELNNSTPLSLYSTKVSIQFGKNCRKMLFVEIYFSRLFEYTLRVHHPQTLTSNRRPQRLENFRRVSRSGPFLQF